MFRSVQHCRPSNPRIPTAASEIPLHFTLDEVATIIVHPLTISFMIINLSLV